jgi:hypothetical protein
MSWTPRLTANDRNGLSTYDSLAPSLGTYSGTGTWPNNCAVTNWAVVVGFKTAAGRPRFVQGAADATPNDIGGFNTFELTMPGPCALGNWMVVDIAWNAGFPLSGCMLTDDAGNFYWPVFAGHGLGAANFLSCWIGKIKIGGGTTLTLRITQQAATSFPFQAINVAAHEYSGLAGAAPPAGYDSSSDGITSHVTADTGVLYPVSISSTNCTYLGDVYDNVSRVSVSQVNLSSAPDGPASDKLQPVEPPPNMGLFTKWSAPDGVYLNSDPVSSFGGSNIVTSTITVAEAALLHFITCDEAHCPGAVPSGGGDPIVGCMETWLAVNEPGTLSPITANEWVDQSERLHLPQPPSVSQVVRQRGKATIPLRVAADDDYSPTIGSQICVWDKTLDDGNFEIFTGTIDDYEIGPLGNDGFRVITVTAVSLEQVFDTIRLKTSKLYENKTCAEIIADMLGDYPTLPVAAGTIDAGVTQASMYLSDYPTYSEVFDRLATLSQFIWGVDPATQQLYFHEPNVEATPFTLHSSEVLWEQLTFKEERHDYRNQQILQANSNAAIQSAELFAGAGQKSFTTLRPIGQITNAWITKNTQNFATGNFTGQPAAGDTASVNYPTAGTGYNWAPAGTYAVGAIIIDSNGYVQKCVVSGGVTGATEPDWIEILGENTTDNLVQWENQGQSGFASGQLTVYRFVEELDNTQFGDVLIGADVDATIQNLVDAINANRDTAGVAFSLPTWENPLVNAEVTSGTSLTVRNKPAGQGYVAGLASTGTAFSWSADLTDGGITTFGTDVITFGVKGQTTGGSIFTIVYTPGSAIVESATPLNAGTSLQVQYLASDAGYVRVEDSAAVTERGRIEQGTGSYQQTSSDDTALSMPDALQLAQQQLEAYGTIPETLVFTIFKPGCYCGQVLDVSLEDPEYAQSIINGQWFVQGIEATMIPVGDLDESQPESFLPDAGRYKYTITCINVSQIGDWIDFWEQMGGGSGGGGAYYPGGGALGDSSNASQVGGVNAQTANYSAVSEDNGRIISFSSASPATAMTLTLPAAPPSTTWCVFVQNASIDQLTVNPNGLDIDGSASSLTLPPASGLYISTDGRNYFTSGFIPPNGEPYDVTFALAGAPPNATIFQLISFPRAVTYLSNFGGSTGHCGTNPTATATYTVSKNGSLAGTVSIDTGGIFTFSTSGAVSFAPGDVLSISTPSTDATLADVTMTFAGTR